LKIGDSIHVKDVVFPANIKVLNEPDAIILAVAAPMKEEAPAEGAVEGEEKKEPEVIKEKKETAEEGKEEEPKKEK
jgi:large subunit ribosomal protein L25